MWRQLRDGVTPCQPSPPLRRVCRRPQAFSARATASPGPNGPNLQLSVKDPGNVVGECVQFGQVAAFRDTFYSAESLLALESQFNRPGAATVRGTAAHQAPHPGMHSNPARAQLRMEEILQRLIHPQLSNYGASG